MRQATELTTAFKPRGDRRLKKSMDTGEYGIMHSSIADVDFQSYDFPVTYATNNVSNYYSASSLIN